MISVRVLTENELLVTKSSLSLKPELSLSAAEQDNARHSETKPLFAYLVSERRRIRGMSCRTMAQNVLATSLLTYSSIESVRRRPIEPSVFRPASEPRPEGRGQR